MNSPGDTSAVSAEITRYCLHGRELYVQDLKAALNVRATRVRQGGRDEEDAESTDRWASTPSSAGQRAIHLGRHHKGWAVVPPTGLQRSVAAANTQLKQKLAVSPPARLLLC